MNSKIISVSCPYTCGELFQGTIDGKPCLVSCPVNIYSTAFLTPGRKQPPLPDKAQRAVSCLPINGLLPISLHQRLPAGRGYGTSTADIGSTLFAAARWAEFPLDPLQASQLAVQIEPTDSSLLPGLALFDHRKAEFHELLGTPPSAIIVIIDPGGIVDSVVFNMHDWTLQLKQLASLHHQAFDLLKNGIANQDLSAIGTASTISAKAHQMILFNPLFDHVLKLSKQLGAAGVCRAHSGTILGMLFSKSSFEQNSIIPFLRNNLPAEIRFHVTELIGGGPILDRGDFYKEYG